MTYDIDFVPSAWREWKKLDPDLRRQLTKKLEERLRHPRVQADALSDMPNCYKIKLRSAGYRLIYEVEDDRLVVMVIAVGKRERGTVFKIAERRLRDRL